MKKLNESTDIRVKDFIDKDFIEGVADYIIEALDNEEKIEVINTILPKQNYELYADRRDYFIVLNMKGKGYPNLTRLASDLAKEFNKDEDEVKQWLNTNFAEIWSEELTFFNENLDYKDVYVTGRSGGYWGFKADSFEFEVDSSQLQEIILKYYLKELETYIEEMLGTDEINNGVKLSYDDGYVFVNDYVTSADKLLDSVSIEKDSFKKLIDFEKEMTAESKYWETTKKWIEDAKANNWLDDLPDVN